VKNQELLDAITAAMSSGGIPCRILTGISEEEQYESF
jgi:hypothetical protein